MMLATSITGNETASIDTWPLQNNRAHYETKMCEGPFHIEEGKATDMGAAIRNELLDVPPLAGVRVNFVVRKGTCMGLLTQSMQAGQRPLALV